MTRVLKSGLALAVLLLACTAASPVQEHFAQAGMSFPLHVNAPDSFTATLVCPGCDVPERLAPEHEALLNRGLAFLDARLSLDYLQKLTDEEAEAFVVSNAYLFESAPGSSVGLAVDVSLYKVAELVGDEIHVPHERHSTSAGEIIELSNTLILESDGDDWEFGGWVY